MNAGRVFHPPRFTGRSRKEDNNCRIPDTGYQMHDVSRIPYLISNILLSDILYPISCTFQETTL